MDYSLATIWHDRSRFLPGMLAVAFSALLIFLQWGLLWGLFSLTSVPVDHAVAQVWVGHPQVLSVDLGRAIPTRWEARLAMQPEVVRTEPYLLGIVLLDKPGGGSELCTLIGTRLDDSSLGAVRELAPELRLRLGELRSFAIDEGELGRLSLRGVGDSAEVFNHRIRLVGVVKKGALRSMTTPYLLCSLDTAHLLFREMPGNQTLFLLARCRDPADAPVVVERLRSRFPDMSAFTSEEMARRTQLHWLTKSRAGIAAGWAALLGLFVGLAITSQTLYSATAAARHEFAVLEAFGIPRWRMATMVLIQSFLLGAIGLGISLPLTFALAWLADALGALVLFPGWLLISGSAVTLFMALLSGLVALRSLRLIEPAELLR